MKSLALINGKVYLDGRLQNKNLLIRGEKIAEIGESIYDSDMSLDCTGMWVLPGGIDPHVHFRTPGMEQKEDWVSGSKAAAKGGITTVLDMPNTNPSTTNKIRLAEKRAIAGRDSIINFGFHFGATDDNLEKIIEIQEVASIKVYFGSTTGNLLVNEESYLEKVIKGTKLPITFHAEDETLIRENREKVKRSNLAQWQLHGMIRNRDVAVSAVQKILKLMKPYDKKAYFCHISTRKEHELIKQAKENGDIYCEATPHHLLLNEEILESIGNFGKVNPPLRKEEDRKYLYQALVNGEIDTIGTDHAPHLKDEKKRDYDHSPSGIPGVETAIPLLLTEVINNRLSLPQFVKLTSQNAVHIFSIKDKGLIQPGYDADLMVIDPAKKDEIRGNKLITKVGWTPFEGAKIEGQVITTIVMGSIAFTNDKFLTTAGTEVNYNR